MKDRRIASQITDACSWLSYRKTKRI